MLINNANVDVAVDVADFEKYNSIFISLLYLMFFDVVNVDFIVIGDIIVDES